MQAHHAVITVQLTVEFEVENFEAFTALKPGFLMPLNKEGWAQAMVTPLAGTLIKALVVDRNLYVETAETEQPKVSILLGTGMARRMN